MYPVLLGDGERNGRRPDGTTLFLGVSFVRRGHKNDYNFHRYLEPRHFVLSEAEKCGERCDCGKRSDKIDMSAQIGCGLK